VIIDLSVPVEDSPSEPIRPQVDFEDHDRTAPLVAGIFGCEVDELPDGKGWASETVTLITHAGTHVDAPYHYFPTCDGERARAIDELPLDWFIRPGVRIDLRGLERGAEITPEHLQDALGGHELEPMDIVLLWTGAEEAWGTPEYVNAGSGLGRDGTLWLLDRGL
jgi:kynurenine formamidase